MKDRAMATEPGPFVAAIVQASPVAGDLVPDPDASLEKLGDLVSDAAREHQARVVNVGETWLPGYPAWIDHCPGAMLWDNPEVKEVFAAYRRASVAVGDERFRRLSEVARTNEVVLIAGVSERVNEGAGQGSLYNTLFTFDADGRMVNHHRKLVPTFTERVIWGYGDGAGLRSSETVVGRVSSLVCWEHWMPLARQVLHVSGEILHAAVWPTVHERHQIASRQYAFEGRCFVLASGQIQRADQHLPRTLDRQADREPDELVLRGGSAIIAPDASYLAGPVFDEEAIIAAEIDPLMVDRESMTLDVTGHYSRPDVFAFGVKPDAASRETTWSPE